MKICIELFGYEAELAGARTLHVDLPDAASVAALRRQLGSAFPALKERLPQCRIARNHEFAAEEERIEAGDAVALIGPVSGG